MGLRFRKSFSLFPGVRLNISKTGMSTSVGPRGFTTNFSRRGARTTLSWLGAGLSYVFGWGKKR